MASRAFDNWQALPITDPVVQYVPLLIAPLFSRSELQVIQIGQRDSVWSIKPRLRLVMMVGQLFGIHPENSLADPRLEAIRRFVVAVKSGQGNLAGTEYQLFQNAGYSAVHCDFIIQRITEKRPLSQR